MSGESVQIVKILRSEVGLYLLTTRASGRRGLLWLSIVNSNVECLILSTLLSTGTASIN